MGYSIAVETFASLEKPWRDLLPTCTTNHIFLTPQWRRVWWQAFGSGHELLLLSVRRDTELVGIIPLMRQGETISFICGRDVCDYMDFIVRQGEELTVFSQLLDYFEPMEWSYMDLHLLHPYSLTLNFLAPLAKQKGYLVEITQEDVSPQILLPSSWDEYLSQLKKKDRHELRRKLRRLDQVKSTRFFTITNKEQLPQGLIDFFALFKLSQGEKADFMTEQMRGFFEAMVEALAEAGYIRLYFLEVDGIRVASALCFDYDNELYLYNSGYDPAYASLSVGLLLKALCIKEGIREGKKRFDFLRGDEPYKYDLGGRDVPIYRCLISRNAHNAHR